MLESPKLSKVDNPVLKLLVRLRGDSPEDADMTPVELAPGIFEVFHFNGHMEFQGIKNKYPAWPDEEALGSAFYEFTGPSSYGVCDSPENLMERYGKYLNVPDRKFVVAMTKVVHNPGNKGMGRAAGGWRWHKWGEYIGNHTHRCEYLDDEEGIDFIYCFAIYELE